MAVQAESGTWALEQYVYGKDIFKQLSHSNPNPEHNTHPAQAGVGELLEAQGVLLAGIALKLTLVDAGGCHRGQGHAIAEEQDYILGLPLVQLWLFQALGDLLVGKIVPELRVLLLLWSGFSLGHGIWVDKVSFAGFCCALRSSHQLELIMDLGHWKGNSVRYL